MDFRKESYLFQQDVDPLGEGDVMVQRLPAPCVLTKCVVRFYPGADLKLEVEPYIKRKPDRPEAIVKIRGKAAPVGQDDIMDLPVEVALDLDDELWVRWRNADAVKINSFYVLFGVQGLGVSA